MFFVKTARLSIFLALFGVQAWAGGPGDTIVDFPNADCVEILTLPQGALPHEIEVVIDPGKVVSWETFKEEYPPYSIALDGFVSAPTNRDLSGPRANFDHHTGADRMATRSTSEQVSLEINMGLFERFRQRGRPKARLFINDCDQDTAMAIWLMVNSHRVRNHLDPGVSRLINTMGLQDTTGGMYPFGNTPQIRKNAWVFQPYSEARREGRLQGMSAKEMGRIILEIYDRISKHVDGKGAEVSLESSYRVISTGTGWSMIREKATDSRMFMVARGINAFVSVIGKGRYVVGRTSAWIPFPLEKIFEALNNAERPGIVTENNRWGGADTIGGSPRETGSTLSEREVATVIEKVLADEKSE